MDKDFYNNNSELWIKIEKNAKECLICKRLVEQKPEFEQLTEEEIAHIKQLFEQKE